jgi:hypothetical protein
MVGMGTVAGFTKVVEKDGGKKVVVPPKVRTAAKTGAEGRKSSCSSCSSGGSSGSSSKAGARQAAAMLTKKGSVERKATASSSTSRARAAGQTTDAPALAEPPASEVAAPAVAPTAPAAAPVAEPPSSAEPIVGKVRVRYNHYNKEFNVVDGTLQFEDIDAEYSFSFVFKGNFTCQLTDGSGSVYAPDGSGLRREMRKDPSGFDPDAEEEAVVGTFSGLALQDADGKQAAYVITVDEDPIVAATETKRNTPYRAPSSTSGAGGGVGPGAARGSALVTAELKNMSADELREGGARYRELLEARDLEDLMGEGL